MNLQDPSCNSEKPTMKAKTLIQVADGNSLQISSLWIFSIPNQPNQAYNCKGWARQQSKKSASISQMLPLKCSIKAFFVFKNTQNQEKSILFCSECAFFVLLTLFSWLVGVSQSGGPQLSNELVLFFSSIIHFRLKTIDHVSLVIVSTDFH